MTTATIDVPVARSASSWARLLAPLSGLALVGGFLMMLFSPAGGDTGETPAEVVAYASSNDGWLLATGLFAIASVALCAGFVTGLHTRLRGIATAGEATLLLVGGVIFTVGLALALTIWSAPLLDMPDDSALALGQAEAYLAMDDIGWFTFAMAGIGAALMAIPASLAVRRAGVPGWLCWTGVVLGVASLGTVGFFGLFAWLAWIAGAAIVMIVAASRG
jgi:hypothetical protein